MLNFVILFRLLYLPQITTLNVHFIFTFKCVSPKASYFLIITDCLSRTSNTRKMERNM